MTEKDAELLERLLQSVTLSDNTQISNILPSVWSEQNIVMEEPFPGLLKYSLTPYWREVIDCFAVDHPMLWIAVMKGAQIGYSAAVLIPMLVWSIVNDPCRIYFMVGSPELVEKATVKLDKGIDGAGARHLIKSQVQRNRSNKSGDTNFMKEFPGGYIQVGNPNNHANIRDVSLRKGLFDDFEAVKPASKQSGSTRKMLEQRFAAYEGRHKICYGSTPEVKETSNIEPAYLLGDQRKYLTPCPCCGEFIEWLWTVTEGDITGGITWELDENQQLIPGSVGYTCQKCGGKYDDRNKQTLLNQGYWKPTAKPSKPGYYSYHISSLYAPLGMYDWAHYVQDYLEACPPGQPRNEALYKTFVNVVLGQTYSPPAETPKATAIMRNVQKYDIGTVPESLSLAQGNGRIVLLTLAADMNGRMKGYNGSDVDDARLDFSVVAHTETGSTYDIMHGSIGTFLPKGGNGDADREIWTYEHGKPRSVWPVFQKLINRTFKTDTGREMPIGITGLDIGYLAVPAGYPFLDTVNGNVVGVKGDKEEDGYMPGLRDVRLIQRGKERPKDTWILQVGYLKDKVSYRMGLRWEDRSQPQPPYFMNFPEPAQGLYGWENYFEHYEAEHRGEIKDNQGKIKFRWVKKTPTAQNHLFDCAVYNTALPLILLQQLATQWGVKDLTWQEFVAAALAQIKT